MGTGGFIRRPRFFKPFLTDDDLDDRKRSASSLILYCYFYLNFNQNLLGFIIIFFRYNYACGRH